MAMWTCVDQVQISNKEYKKRVIKKVENVYGGGGWMRT